MPVGLAGDDRAIQRETRIFMHDECVKNTASQVFFLRSTFTKSVNFRKLGPLMGVLDSKLDSFCGGLTIAKNPG